jgi:hypothetical protein
MKPSRIGIFGLVVILCACGAEQAAAQSQKHRAQPPPLQIPVDETGTPIIMQGLEQPKKAARGRHQPQEQADRKVKIPRGSSAYVAPIPLPRGPSPSEALTPPPVATYQPPKLNTFSDRVGQCIQSFPLNAGIGLNPTGRDAYVVHCVNN